MENIDPPDRKVNSCGFPTEEMDEILGEIRALAVSRAEEFLDLRDVPGRSQVQVKLKMSEGAMFLAPQRTDDALYDKRLLKLAFAEEMYNAEQRGLRRGLKLAHRRATDGRTIGEYLNWFNTVL